MGALGRYRRVSCSKATVLDTGAATSHRQCPYTIGQLMGCDPGAVYFRHASHTSCPSQFFLNIHSRYAFHTSYHSGNPDTLSLNSSQRPYVRWNRASRTAPCTTGLRSVHRASFMDLSRPTASWMGALGLSRPRPCGPTSRSFRAMSEGLQL